MKTAIKIFIALIFVLGAFYTGYNRSERKHEKIKQELEEKLTKEREKSEQLEMNLSLLEDKINALQPKRLKDTLKEKQIGITPAISNSGEQLKKK